jgi:hypothetical protein
MLRVATGALLLSASIAVAACASDPADEKTAAATKLIALTRETRTTYSMVVWNRIQRPGAAIVEEWSAEFHDGIRHRVETPRDRMVADCVAMTGTYVEIPTGKIITGARVARAAWGINANMPILAARIGGKHQNRFGGVVRVAVVDSDNVRTYDVAENGALLAATISDRKGNRLLTNWAVSYSPDVPADIFSEASLARSVVPDELKRAPMPGLHSR